MNSHQAEESMNNYIRNLDDTFKIGHKKLAEESGISKDTWASWKYKDNFPLSKLFHCKYCVEILEHALSLAIDVWHEKREVRLIEIKKAVLELEESYEIENERYMNRAISKIKALLNFFRIETNPVKQGRLAF